MVGGRWLGGARSQGVALGDAGSRGEVTGARMTPHMGRGRLVWAGTPLGVANVAPIDLAAARVTIARLTWANVTAILRRTRARAFDRAIYGPPMATGSGVPTASDSRRATLGFAMFAAPRRLAPPSTTAATSWTTDAFL